MSEELRLCCDYCGRNPNSCGEPDFVYVNPHGCGHDLCSDHVNLRSRDGGGKECRICHAEKQKKALAANLPVC